MKIKVKDLLICIALFTITLSGASYIIDRGMESIFEMCGYAILLPVGIFYSFYKGNYANSLKKVFLFLFIVFLMSYGFLGQELSLKRKLLLLFTVIGICSVTLLAEGVLDSLRQIRAGAYAIFAAVCVASALTVLSGGEIWEELPSGIGGILIGINGGIQYKNYFAGNMLAVFIGIYLYYRFEEKKKQDLIIMILSVMCLVLSNSRGGLLLLACFLLGMCYEKLKFMKASQRKIFLACVITICFVLVICLFDSVIMNFPTFAYRFHGLLNYIAYFKNAPGRMLFGSAELMYDQKMSYVMTVRTMTGIDGTLENAWLNILIKSGFLGIAAYIILFVRFLYIAAKCDDWYIKSSIVAITVMLLASSFVEIYIQSVHCILGVYLYLIIAGLNRVNVERKNISQRIKVEK